MSSSPLYKRKERNEGLKERHGAVDKPSLVQWFCNGCWLPLLCEKTGAIIPDLTAGWQVGRQNGA